MAGLDRELEVAERLAREAGRVILEVYARPFEVVQKAKGGGPVTEADERANALLVEGLRAAFPGDGVVAEETKDTSDASRFSRCWYVDPVDGTAEFVDRNGMFAVHVGLAIDGEAKLGVVYRPVGDKLYAGVVGGEAFVRDAGARRPLAVSAVAAPAALRLVTSRSHKSKKTGAIVERLGIGSRTELGSVGLKCGLLAEGGADLYVHFSPKSWRWDACAPEAVLRAAGGVLTDLGGTPYRYDGSELMNARGLVGCNAAAFPAVIPVIAEIARAHGLV